MSRAATLRTCAVGVLLVSILSPATATTLQKDPAETIDELLRKIRADRDEVTSRDLYTLAAPGDRRSFDALVRVIGWLSSPDTLAMAFNAFSYFRANDELAGEAAEFLADRALDSGRSETRVAAVRPLSYFGKRSMASYERILRESKDPRVRQLAIRPVIGRLAEHGDVESLELILDVAAPADVARRKPSPLSKFDPKIARPLLVAKLADRRTEVGWRLLLIDVLVEDPGPDVTQILKTLLRNRSTTLQIAAIRALAQRGEEEIAKVELQRMRRSARPQVLVEITGILTRLSVGDPSWTKTLDSLARSPDYFDRIAAMYGYLDLGADEGACKLVDMLDDPSWKVRAAVLESMEIARRREFLEPLIERLDAEDGRLAWDVACTLTRLTGLMLGRQSGTWKRWWAAEGADFRLPTVEEIRELEAKREAARAENPTEATFYGLPVYSRRVCFVVDVSGSMREPATLEARTQSEARRTTRLDAAKEELRTLVGRLTPDSRCNFVFFSYDLDTWSDEVVTMDAEAREEALDFVAAQRAGGGTNLYEALVVALSDEEVDSIYVLSDGEPTVGEVTEPLQIQREIEQLNKLARVTFHAISIGRESDLLRALATGTNGRYVAVGLPKEDEEDAK